MVYYEAIVGSRSYGLDIPGSDTDIASVSDTWNHRKYRNGRHDLQCPREVFLERALLEDQTVHAFQWLFPACFLSTGGVTRFVTEYREQIVQNGLPAVWSILYGNACGLASYGEHYYAAFPKRLAYSTLRFDTLARYASGEPFAKATVPQGELRELLLVMRTGTLSVQDALLVNRNAKNRADQVCGFYDKVPDVAFQLWAKETLRVLLRLT